MHKIGNFVGWISNPKILIENIYDTVNGTVFYQMVIILIVMLAPVLWLWCKKKINIKTNSEKTEVQT